MIIVKIFGGLGNQLYQYAAAKYLAEKHKVPIRLDLSAFDSDKLRNFDLQKFNTKFAIASKEDIANLLPRNNIAKALQYLRPKEKRTYHRERGLHFDNTFSSIGPNVYLKGYFQSERYFLPIEQIIRAEFALDRSYTLQVEDIATNMRNEPSVSVHIRRGDYTDPEVLRIHGVLQKDYYQKAITMAKQAIPNARFYFFSDDAGWVKENFDLTNSVIVSGQHTTSHVEDFYLMSQCRNNIIANSSFSWWCAWLNDNSEKLVVAPASWFAARPDDSADRIPDSWKQIASPLAQKL